METVLYTHPQCAPNYHVGGPRKKGSIGWFVLAKMKKLRYWGGNKIVKEVFLVLLSPVDWSEVLVPGLERLHQGV